MDKFQRNCRLCLKVGDFGSIFDEANSFKLSEMVMSITNITITEDDGLPDRVCASCIQNISTAYVFKLQCEKHDSTLRKYLVDSETKLTHIHVAQYNNFIEHDLLIPSHCENNECENVYNENENNDNAIMGSSLEVSDDTDSDVDSVKCVFCNKPHNSIAAHKCNVVCTIEHNQLQRSSSNETLVAEELSSHFDPNDSTTVLCQKPANVRVSCVLCDDKYDNYNDYVTHLNKCITNVKLHHFVCPICHDIFSDKLIYLEHLRMNHFNLETIPDAGLDCVDFAPMVERNKEPKDVRRQIGWSVEDIYQEIEYKKIDGKKPTSTSSPIKSFFSKFGNDTFSRQSTPKKVSFRGLFETSKTKTSNILPFRKYIQNYRNKKKFESYSPIKGKMQVTTRVKTYLPELVSDSDYGSPSGTSEESWKLKQSLICACDKKIFMLSECILNRDRLVSMINELGGVVAENTKMEMLSTHFIAILPEDTLTGMMVCALATGKWLLHVNFIYDSFRNKRFVNEDLYEWKRHPKIIELDNTSVEIAKAAVYWHLELTALSARYPFEGKQIVLIMKKKYRQYYQMIFKTLKAKTINYDPRTPGSCCSADYCFVDMKIIERVKLKFFSAHNVPVFPYQYILVFLLKRGNVVDEHKYLLQECGRTISSNDNYIFNNTY